MGGGFAMKPARIVLTPKIMTRLQAGKTAVFRLPENVREVHVSIVKQDDYSSFDRLFDRLFKGIFKNW